MTILKQASLLMYPSGYKEDKLYSILPSDGSGDLSFARSSVGTRVNSDGFIETMPPNIMLNSEPTTTGSFQTGVVFQPTSIYGWNGIYYGDNSVRRIAFFSTTTIVGKEYTFSVFVKMTDGSIPSVGNTATDDFRMWNGSATTNGLTITDVGGGIYRCSVVRVATSTTNNVAVEKQTYNSAKTFEVSGFQLVDGSIPKPYYSTTDRLNYPRLDYTGGGCGKLLIEPQSTNSLIYSEQFDNSYWSKTGVSIIANDTIAPDGTMTADRATNLFTGQKNIQKSITSGAGAFSVYAKKGVGDTFQLLTLSPTVSSTFDLQNVTASGVGVIQEIGNGWYRCSIPITGTTQVRIYPPPILNDYLYLWGAQLEGVTAATSYIPTSGTTVTRTQDVSKTSGLSALINSVEGVLFWEGNLKDNDTINSFISISDGTNTVSNSLNLQLRPSSNSLWWQFIVGNSIQVSKIVTLTDIFAKTKLAFKWEANDFCIFENGTKISFDTAGITFPANTLNSLYFAAANAAGSFNTNLKTNALAVYSTALSDADLQELTTL